MNIIRDGYGLVRKNLLLFIILLALVGRVLAVFVIGNTELQHEYAPIVMNLLSGRGFAYFSIDQNNALTAEFLESPKLVIPSAFKSPVYPFFLAALVKVFGFGYTGMWAIEIVQAILGALMCWFIYEISKDKFGVPQALLAAAGMGFYPLLVYSSTQISDTVIFLTLEILTIWLFIKLEKGFSLGWIIAFSLSFGLFMLARPEGFLYFPFFLIWILIRFPQRKLYAPFLFTVICVLIILPWGIRNYYQLGKFTMNTSAGLNLWEGQNKDAVGVPSWYVQPTISISDAMTKEIFGSGFDRNFEVRQDQVYFKYAIQDMKTYPMHSVTLAVKKMLFFWSSIYFGVNFVYPGAKSALYWLPWLLMLPFFIYGLALSLKDNKKYFLFYLVFAVSTFTCMVFFVLPRYTILTYPWVIVFAAHGAWSIYNSSFRRSLGRLPVEKQTALHQ
jgi:4-amino-4-deoxy-L-arabinose transferase-like glycosyltransferase